MGGNNTRRLTPVLQTFETAQAHSIPPLQKAPRQSTAPAGAIPLNWGRFFLSSVHGGPHQIATDTVARRPSRVLPVLFCLSDDHFLWLLANGGDLRDGLKASNLMGHVARIFGTTAMAL